MSIKINNKTIAGRSQTNATRFIGEIFQSALPIDDPRVALLDGHIISIDSGYGAFIQHITNLVHTYPQLACTEEEWQQSNTTYGECGKFVVNMDNVRLPKIVSFVEGLSSLEDLGKLLQAGLPNHTHGENFLFSEGVRPLASQYNLPATEGNEKSLTQNIPHTSNNTKGILQTEGASNATYGKSNTVQPQAIRYPYYIVLATNTLTAINVRQELTTNNPFTLFESKYSDIEINNTSWLLSVGQWNSGDVYVSAYEALVKDYNNENKLGVKLHTETYDDYNFVLNQQDKTFRLPLLDGTEDMISSKVTDLTLQETATSYIAPANGFYACGITSSTRDATQYFELVNVTQGQISSSANFTGGWGRAYLQVNKGDQITIYYGGSALDVRMFRFIYATGNGSLYYYVGETNINVNLVNVGKLSNELTVLHKQKMDKQGNATVIESYKSGTSWYRVWSDGWCEQGGLGSTSFAASNTGTETITLLKPYKDTNYTATVNKVTTTTAASHTVSYSIISNSQLRLNNNGSVAGKISWTTYGYKA